MRFHYRHKETGLEYEGRMRHVWRVEGDKIVHFEEFHDAERVRTFFRLLAQAKAELAGRTAGLRLRRALLTQVRYGSYTVRAA